MDVDEITFHEYTVQPYALNRLLYYKDIEPSFLLNYTFLRRSWTVLFLKRACSNAGSAPNRWPDCVCFYFFNPILSLQMK